MLWYFTCGESYGAPCPELGIEHWKRMQVIGGTASLGFLLQRVWRNFFLSCNRKYYAVWALWRCCVASVVTSFFPCVCGGGCFLLPFMHSVAVPVRLPLRALCPSVTLKTGSFALRQCWNRMRWGWSRRPLSSVPPIGECRHEIR